MRPVYDFMSGSKSQGEMADIYGTRDQSHDLDTDGCVSIQTRLFITVSTHGQEHRRPLNPNQLPDRNQESRDSQSSTRSSSLLNLAHTARHCCPSLHRGRSTGIGWRAHTDVDSDSRWLVLSFG